jgi:cytochrome c oxidase cbb3-type subunit 3
MSNKDNDNDEKLLDHNYDGIQELDNPLPNWWLITFYGAIVFSVFYFFYYQIGSGPSIKAQYNENLTYHQKIKSKYLDELSKFNNEKYMMISEVEEMKKFGKTLYENNCLSCHGVNAAGDIGPNLTDEYWLFADGKPETIYPFVIKGSTAAGMPAWGEYLQEDELYAVITYLMSVQGMQHAKAKEAQGEHFPRTAKQSSQKTNN